MVRHIKAQEEELDCFLFHIVTVIGHISGIFNEPSDLQLTLERLLYYLFVPTFKRVQKPGHELKWVSLATESFLFHGAIVAAEALLRRH